jgi:hypothetical protein
MHTLQRGMTFIGFLILMVFLGVFVYAGIRLVPVYVEYMNIAKAIDAAKTSQAGSADGIRNAIEKRFEVDDVHSLTSKEVEIKRQGDSWMIHAAYDAEAPFMGNVSFLVHFDKLLVLDSSSGP